MDAVAAAFEAVPRREFLPRGQRYRASYNGPIDIGYGQTNSQPITVEDMLRLLDVQPGQRVLDVGSGSGWTTGLLAHLTGPEGEVYGVELVPDLVTAGRRHLGHFDFPWASISQAEEGVLGLPEWAPYDRILVSADPSTLPQQLLHQFGDPGIMVIPVNGTMLRIIREQGELTTTRHGGYRFVPLR